MDYKNAAITGACVAAIGSSVAAIASSALVIKNVLERDENQSTQSTPQQQNWADRVQSAPESTAERVR